IGFDAFVAHRFAAHGSRGLKTYVSVGLRGLASVPAEELEVELDGMISKEEGFVVAVANTSEYGNGARLAPRASSSDGLLDLVIVQRPSIVHMPLLALRLFSGSFDRGRRVTTRRAKEITIRRPVAGPAHVDGEPIHLPQELRVEIREQSLRVLLPAVVERF
ncbi:MAG TPA: hypothetical protein VKH35_05920, partial [Thermoanaerobaculia bacterium]|nr:hypothetical protein [Thermoanaerobaculia bacterium]